MSFDDAYTCTIARDGSRRYFHNGKPIKASSFKEQYPSFSERNCLHTAQRARLVKRFNKHNVNLLTNAYTKLNLLSAASTTSLSSSIESCTELQTALQQSQANTTKVQSTVQSIMNENLKLATLIKEMQSAHEQTLKELEKVKAASSTSLSAEPPLNDYKQLHAESQAMIVKLKEQLAQQTSTTTFNKAERKQLKDALNNAQLLESTCAQKVVKVEKELEQLRRKADEIGDVCLVSDANARVCLDKIRNKFGNITGLLVDDKGMMEGMLTSGGQLYIVPAEYTLKMDEALMQNVVPIEMIDSKTGHTTTSNVIAIQPQGFPSSSADTFITVVTKDMTSLTPEEVETIVPLTPISNKGVSSSTFSTPIVQPSPPRVRPSYFNEMDIDESLPLIDFGTPISPFDFRRSPS